MLKSLLLIMCLLLQSLPGVQAADSAESKESKESKGAPVLSMSSEGPVQLELQTIAPIDSAQERAALSQMAREIAKHPGAEVNVLELSEEGQTSARREQQAMTQILLDEIKNANDTIRNVNVSQASVPVSFSQKAQTRFQGARELFYKHERVSLSLLRASVNGTIVSLGLILNTGLPAITAIPIGILAGALSGSMQYLNPQVQRLLEGNTARNKELIRQGRLGSLRVKTYQLTKWWMMEAGFLALIDGFSAAIGAPTENLQGELVKLVKSSLMSTASQGVWDATIASQTGEQLRQAGSNQALRQRIQVRSNIITFGVSMASVFGAVLSMMGSPVGSWALGALGVTGALYTAVSWARSRPVSINRPKLISAHCRGVFAGF